MVNLKTFLDKQKIIFNILFSLIPLSYIIGNFAINLNIFLLIVFGLIIYNKRIFKIRLLFIDKIIITFFLLSIFSAIVNSIESNLVKQDNSTLIKTILYYRYLLLYFVLRYLIENQKIYFKWFFISSLVCTLFVSFDIFYQFIFFQDIFGLKPLHPSKLSGPFGDELIAGGYIYKFAIFGIFAFPFFKIKKIYLSLTLALLFLIYVIAIMLSGNRMPFVLFILAIFLILLFEKKTRKYIPVSFVIITCIFFVIYKNNQSIKNSFDSFKDNSISMIKIFVVENISKSSQIPEKEIPMYYQELKSFYGTWMMNKYIGGGIKSFRHNCPKRKILSHNERTTCNMHPHNYYLEILTDTGLIGFILSCLIFFSVIYHSIIKNYFLKSTTQINIILVPFTFVFISEIFPFRLSGSFFTTSTSTFIFILIATIIAFSKKNIKN